MSNPIYLVTVNSTPEKAKDLVAAVINVPLIQILVPRSSTDFLQALKDEYNLVHVANCESGMIKALY